MNNIAETFRDTQIRDDVLSNGSVVRFWPISFSQRVDSPLALEELAVCQFLFLCRQPEH